jgi:hypothetical protein
VKKVVFTPRHSKLVELHESIGVLLLGQKNKEYIKELKMLREKTVEELKKEEAKSRIMGI